ncbi:ComF family protein [Thalassobacillus pellis]|uniref:ComF family protein n=1 Tax=Thalassobacillus pellis TaxID=748008 RepID=UPI001961D47A|nr:ComF family protein [Thalassobacillus pellis]MBM7551438.1 competence protein ComFC [Thalassobacillus pellis]
MHCINCHEVFMQQTFWSNLFLPDKRNPVCDDCRNKLIFLTEPVCPKCCRPMDKPDLCLDCQSWGGNSDILNKNISIFSYNQAIKDIINRWKYRGDYLLGKVFQYELARVFNQHYKNLEAVAIPIPLSKERMLERGFNQAESLAGFLDIPMVHALTRIHSEKQSKKSRTERVTAQNPFRLTRSVISPVILVDDIYTTGTTIRHAASLLKEAGVKEVYALTLIRS